MDRRGFLKGAGQVTVAGAVGAALRPANALIGMLGGSASGSSPPALGNLVGVNYAAGGSAAQSFEGFPLFKNLVRKGRGFTLPNTFSYYQVQTSGGWPTQDCCVMPFEGAVVPSYMTAATSGNPCKGYFKGTGSESVTAQGFCTVSNVVPGTGGAYTTFDLYNITGDFGFNITGTTGGVTDIALYPPGYDLGGIDDITQQSAYWPDAITKYSALGGIRWMWMSNACYNTIQTVESTAVSAPVAILGQITSGSGYTSSTYYNVAMTGGSGTGAQATITVSGGGVSAVTISAGGTGYKTGDVLSAAAASIGGTGSGFSVTVVAIGVRNTPANTQANRGWTGSEGYPIEWAAYFCKFCGSGSSLWVCLPVWEDGTNGAAGTYSNELLTMLNTVLVPNGNTIYLEIGNELWNTGTYPVGVGSGETINTLAVASGLATSNTDYAGCYKYLGYRYHALANMCRTIFGSKFGTQVKIVFAGGASGAAVGQYVGTGLEYMNSTYGSPSADVQHTAESQYVNLATPSTDSSIAAVISDLQTVGPASPPLRLTEHNLILALRYGLTLLSYEGASWQVNAEPTISTFSGSISSGTLNVSSVNTVSTFTGSITGNILTISSYATQKRVLLINDTIAGAGVTAGTKITAVNADGTYNVTSTPNVSLESLSAYGTLYVGMLLDDGNNGIPTGVTITAFGTGSGLTGTYTISNASISLGSGSSINGLNAFIGPAIMDASMEATLRDYIMKPAIDYGVDGQFAFESGVSVAGTFAYSPTNEWSNDYAGFISGGSPRYKAMTDLASGTTYQPQRNVLTARGQVFGASAFWDNSPTSQNFNAFTFGFGSLINYATGMQINVNNPSLAGSYSLVLDASSGSTASATVEVNGVGVYTGALAAGNNTITGVTLKAGRNAILIYNANGLVALNSITVN